MTQQPLPIYGPRPCYTQAAPDPADSCRHDWTLTTGDDGELVDYCIRCGSEREPNDQSRNLFAALNRADQARRTRLERW